MAVFPVTWLGQTDVTVSGTSTITKTGLGVGWDAGAYSQESVASGDIKLECTLPSAGTQGVIGLSDETQAQADVNFTSIDFAIFPYLGDLYVFENGSNLGSFTTYTTGDLISIEVAGGVVNYRKNGGAPFRTVSSPTLNYPLCVDVSFQEGGANFVDCTVEFPATIALAGELTGDTTITGALTAGDLAGALLGSTDLTGNLGYHLSVAGALVGATDMTGDLSFPSLGLRGPLIGSTQIFGTLGGKLSLSGQLAGSTYLAPAFLRLGGEPNIFLEGELAGSTDMTGSLILGSGFEGELVGATELHGDLTIHSPAESSITIFVDIIDSDIVAAQNAQTRRYTSRLLVDGDPVPIKSATLEARKESLGTELRVVLAIPDRSQVSFTANITFQIGLWVSSDWVWIPLLEGGRLSSVENPIRNDSGRPADEVSISIVDVIADRWDRAPRTPIHLYDPNELSAPDQSLIASQKIEIQNGGVILPVNTPIAGMTLQDVLQAAYVTGTGFNSVITNIPDFPVPEADFTLDGGYDAGVRPLLTLFDPLMFERNNVLFIIDPDGPLPAGFTARSFPQSLTRELNDSTPQHAPVNAILLRLKDGLAGEYSTERLDAELAYGGQFGTPNYTETLTERRVREWRNFAAPDVIVREEEINETTTVQAVDPVDGFTRVVEEATLEQTFDTLGRKTGHVRRVSKRLPDLNNAGVMTLLSDVTRQVQTISYRPSPTNSKQTVQDVVSTVESGLVVVDEDNQYLGLPYKIPLLDGHVSGYLDPDANQSVTTSDIRTTTEALRVRGQQVDVEIRTINHISNSSTSSVSTRPGTVEMNNRSQSAARTLLITIPGTDALGRRAQTFDAGILPADLAINLGERKLRRLNNPPRQISLSPAYVDLGIKRGSLLEIEARGVTVGNYLVEGFSISFAAYSQESGAEVTMSVSAREVGD